MVSLEPQRVEMLKVENSADRNHYETLQVPQTASKSEIHSAFRKLVKIYHPDKNPKRVKWAESQMRELLEAYRIVSNEDLRQSYDRTLRTRRETVSFVERMSRKADDMRAQAQLVLHYLLEGQYDDGVTLYERLLTRRAGFCMSNHLDEYDYLDSLFLLGEAYEYRREWRAAARHYWKAYEMEKNGPKKRYFFEELQDRLRVLFSQRLVQGLSPEDALRNYERALAVSGGGREAALIYKKIAALHHRLGRPDDAVRALDKASNICPGLKAIQSMRKRIAGT